MPTAELSDRPATLDSCSPDSMESRVPALLDEAESLHHRGELDQAEQLYRRVLRDQPKEPTANYKLGQMAVNAGDYPAALTSLHAALQAEPANPIYWRGCIEALQLAGQGETAAQMLHIAQESGLEIEPVAGAGRSLAERPAEADLSRLRVRKPSRTRRRKPLPAPEDLRRLVECVQRGENQAAERLARSVTGRFPEDGLAWKALGVVLERLGRRSDSLEAKRTAARLLPHDVEAQRNCAHSLIAAGAFREGETVIRQALALEPGSSELASALGMVLQQVGKVEEALACCRQALCWRPDYVEGHAILGRVLEQQQGYAEAEQCYRRAISLQPSRASRYLELGHLLERRGRPTDAESCFREASTVDPADALARLALGIVLQQQGLVAEAELAYRRAIALDPTLAAAHSNLAGALKAQGRLTPQEAETYYRRALEIDPRLAAAHSNLSGSLLDQRRYAEAEASCRRALALDGALGQAHNNLAGALLRQGRAIEAETHCQQAIAMDPRSGEACNNLGTSQRDQGRYFEAEASYRRALTLQPRLAEAHSNLGSLLLKQSRLSEAESCCRQALLLRPAFGEAHTTLGNVLLEMGRLKECADSSREALARNPELMEAHSQLLYCLAHDPAVSPSALFAEHLNFGRCFGERLRSSWPVHGNPRDPQRRLRVGFVSADLRDHAVAYFLEPVLQKLCNREDFLLHAYSNDPRVDATTLRLQRLFHLWDGVSGLDDEQLSRKIEGDRIDILVDLSGHTAGQRLLTFARKPAPVQASWIGYPGTTGLEAMDYYLGDGYFLPHEPFASQFTEKLLHLPAVSPFLLPPDSPPIQPLPALTNGYLTLGSFNRMAKLNPAVLALWSQLLRALPKTRLLIGALPRDGSDAGLIERFAREGISRERLLLHPRSDLHSYLELHQQVDLCLDAFPYGGCTTTSHALWMGVPTLSLAGRMPAGREGSTFLSHAGLKSFIAEDQEDFLHKGLAWARAVDELAEIRRGMRARLDLCVLGRPEIIADGLANAFRRMWRRWSSGLPPEAF